MADHMELAGEIHLVEKMTTQDRLKHAKKRRLYQLKKWTQYEKNLGKEHTKKRKSDKVQLPPPKKVSKHGDTRVSFISNVMLLEAAARNDIEEAQVLLQQGVSPDVANEDGLTALHQCCIDDNEEMLTLLLKHGANVNAIDSELWTPLHAAATCGHVHLCKLLIDGGANLLSVNADGNMPYDICEDEVTLDYVESEMARKGITQEQIDDTRLVPENAMLGDLQLRLEEGHDINFRDEVGATPVHVAAANGYIQVMEFLLRNSAAINIRDDDSWMPIHAAACWCQHELLEMLVHNGANIDSKTRNGETPFDICEDPDLKQKILDMKDEIESKEASKRTQQILRRRSHSRRSASIRRSSMREKTLMSLKEAKEEAQRFDVKVNADEEEEETHSSQKEHVPTTNIDDVTLSMVEEPDSPPIAEPDEHVAEPITDNNNKQHLNNNINHNHAQPHQTPDISASAAAGSDVDVDRILPDVARIHVNETKISHEEDEPSSHEDKDVTKHLDKTPDNQTVVHELEKDFASAQRNDVIPPQSVHMDANHQVTANSSANMDANHQVTANSTNVPVKLPVSVRSGQEIRYPSGAKSGTLSDLKKQRAEFNNTLGRSKNPPRVDVQVQNMFLASVNTDPNPVPPTPQIPQQNNVKIVKPSGNGPNQLSHAKNGHGGSSIPPSSRDSTRLQKFRAPLGSQVIGDDDGKQKCCIIM